MYQFQFQPDLLRILFVVLCLVADQLHPGLAAALSHIRWRISQRRRVRSATESSMMHWSDERYVRLYTRDTAAWLALRWQARALLPLLLRKADRAGVIETTHGVRLIPGLVALPLEVVEPGMEDLLRDGCVELHELGYVIPNFIAAQEVGQSSKSRMQLSRDRRAAGLPPRREREDVENPAGDESQRDSCAAQPNVAECNPGVAPLVRHGTARHGLDLQGHGPRPEPEPRRPARASRRKAGDGAMPPAPAKVKRATTKAPLIALPDGWIANADNAKTAADFELDLARAVSDFRDWATEKGEKYAGEAGWQARFHRWLMRQSDFKQQERARSAPRTNGRHGHHEPHPQAVYDAAAAAADKGFT